MSTLVNNQESSKEKHINTELFYGQNGHNFWVGRIATLDSVESIKVFDATSVLRAEVYTSLGYLSSDRIDSLGREIDDDDCRSVHFAVLENNLNKDGIKNQGAKVIGTSRLIIKDSWSNKLPIEKYFPDVFANNPAPIGSAEGSRLIAEHKDKRIQYKIALSLVRAMTHYSLSKNVPMDFGLAEERLLRLFDVSGIPTRILGDKKDIPEYGGVLYPIEIEVSKITKNGSANGLARTALKKFFSDGSEDLGEGFYDSSFMHTRGQ